MLEVRKALETDKPPLALHVCCGPCSTAVIERLQQDWTVLAIWHNPNIQPESEYRARLEAMELVAKIMKIPLVELEYDAEEWIEACEGLMDEEEGGARCDECMQLRLARTAQWAAEHGVDAIASTLTVSPHKDADLVNEIGSEVAAGEGLIFLKRDFKHEGGFQRSVELSKRWGIYRQKYCGCLPSRRR